MMDADEYQKLMYYNQMQAMRLQQMPPGPLRGVALWFEPKAEKPNPLLLLETEE